MNFERLIERVKAIQTGEATGHDWYHTYRVAGMSRQIGEMEDCNMDIVLAAAYLHDVADHKFGYTKESRGELLRSLMEEAEFSVELQSDVLEVV